MEQLELEIGSSNSFETIHALGRLFTSGMFFHLFPDAYVPKELLFILHLKSWS